MPGAIRILANHLLFLFWHAIRVQPLALIYEMRPALS